MSACCLRQFETWLLQLLYPTLILGTSSGSLENPGKPWRASIQTAGSTVARSSAWQAIPYIARLLGPHKIGVVHPPAGTLRSRLMRIKDRIDPKEQSNWLSTELGVRPVAITTHDRLRGGAPVIYKVLQRESIPYGLTLRGYRPRLRSCRNKDSQPR